MDFVREGFRQWKSLGIGLDFQEVTTPDEADVRIGFAPGEGSWSYVGRDALDIPGQHERTMNFGWRIGADPRGVDVAVHEIGHVLGFREEHQNPNSGIVWDEDAVYAQMGSAPNYWSREQINAQIIHKGELAQYYGPWDPNSIMHFAFSKGLIREPAEYREGLNPSPGLSAGDKDKIRFLYPPLTSLRPVLVPLEAAPLSMQPGEQANYTIIPSESRRYNIQTVGPGQVVMMLFEERDGQLVSLAADDNSEQNRNAQIEAEIDLDRKYVLRVRLLEDGGDSALMMW